MLVHLTSLAIESKIMNKTIREDLVLNSICNLAVLGSEYVFGNKNFGFKWHTSHPAITVFGFDIYLYALAIVTGMCLAILVAAKFFKKRGYDPYDITIYALAVIPLGVLGARAYVYIFPWEGSTSDWSTFFNFRNGGLGIYGGVIVGYIAAFVVSKIKKQDFRIIADAIIPGVMLAQCLGRWGNFFNQEAYGNLVSSNYSDFVNFWSVFGAGPDHGFNGLYVWIDAAHGYSTGGAGWYQATFFYESFFNLIGFLICILVLTRSKKYKLGWCTSFYGIYYGIVRLIIEGMRTDSLFLYVGTMQTDIKISQLVSVFTIVFGCWTLSKIYRQELHSLYKRFFKSERSEVANSRWVLLIASCLLIGCSAIMFVLGGATRFLIGIASACLAVYATLGIFACNDRLKMYCSSCGNRLAGIDDCVSEHRKQFTALVCYAALTLLLFVFGLFAAICWGYLNKIDNGYVVGVICLLLMVAVIYAKLVPSIKLWMSSDKNNKNSDSKDGLFVSCECGQNTTVSLNSFLLFIFPPKHYKDYGVDKLMPYTEEKADSK